MREPPGAGGAGARLAASGPDCADSAWGLAEIEGSQPSMAATATALRIMMDTAADATRGWSPRRGEPDCVAGFMWMLQRH
ncbi:hypothetical protein AD428_10505 [Achromobacter sp. DMS1]|nr:hypothetical protein AD428_10505 [Achromobacter sp. DMS1]